MKNGEKNNMTTKNLLLQYVDKTKPGLEIGPSLNPAVTKKDGFNVKILDHLSESELKQKYKHRDLTKIESVDYVWKGESYRSIIGEDVYFDWILASHVIEHTTDMITFLNECSNLLTSTGIISLAIPDHRYCFDHYRVKSSIAQVIDAFHYKNTKHTIGSISEHYLSAVKNKGRLAWSKARLDNEYSLCFTTSQALSKIKLNVAAQEYIDVHNWKLTPNHFQSIIVDLNLLGYIDLKIKSISRTIGHEFFATLTKGAYSSTKNRLDVMNLAKTEC